MRFKKVVFVEDELILLGFFRKRFFVYNEDKKYEVLANLDYFILIYIRSFVKIICIFVRCFP